MNNQLTHRFMLCLILLHALLSPVRAHSPADDMAQAALNLLQSLSPEQKNQAAFEFKSDQRFDWHFIPRARKGLSLKEMTPAQRHLAHALLNAPLSHRGYLKATTIMSLEAVLLEIEQGKGPVRDPELYFVSIFGKPGPHATWGWRFEGHHLSLNFTVANGNAVSVTPSFFGSNPAQVRTGSRQGLRLLGQEEDLARQLVRSLNPEQRKTAVFAQTAPKDIVTGADRTARLLQPAGLAAKDMTPDQNALLAKIIREYLSRYRTELAELDLAKIEKTGPNRISFAWAGPIEPGQGHYYRIQGPAFLLEYDNTQNNANHIHSVWRDLENDFGQDLLRQHYLSSPHHQSP